MAKEGDNAPDFKLDGSDGNKHSLGEFKGKLLVLYFYPKDDTPGCTIEAKTFNQHRADFDALGATVVGVSKDDFDSHCKFAEKHGLQFLLLSDPSSKMIKKYGAYGDRGIFGMGTIRNTYLIGKDSKILRVFEKVSPNKNPQDLLNAIKALQQRSKK